jgi:AcrR family transcriptional regulator
MAGDSRLGDKTEGILAAAGKLFRERGYAATTTRDIATAARVLPGTLHYWFPTKFALLQRLMERACARLMARVDEAAAQSSHPGKRLRLALRAYLELLLSDKDAMAALVFEYRFVEPEHRGAILRLRNRVDRKWERLLQEAAGAGQLRPGLDLSMARLFGLGAIHGTLQWFSPDGKYSAGEIAELYADFFAGGVFGTGAPEALVSRGVDSAGASYKPRV